MLNRSSAQTLGSFRFRIRRPGTVVDAFGSNFAGMLVRAIELALGYLTAALLGIAPSREVGRIPVFWPANALLRSEADGGVPV